MRETYLNTDEAPNKWWAARDARMRNYANKSHYDAETQLRVDRMRGALEVLYVSRGVYEAYGKKGITIKVDQGRVRDARSLADIEKDWERLGVTKKVTPQGVIYKVK